MTNYRTTEKYDCKNKNNVYRYMIITTSLFFIKSDYWGLFNSKLKYRSTSSRCIDSL